MIPARCLFPGACFLVALSACSQPAPEEASDDGWLSVGTATDESAADAASGPADSSDDGSSTEVGDESGADGQAEDTGSTTGEDSSDTGETSTSGGDGDGDGDPDTGATTAGDGDTDSPLEPGASLGLFQHTYYWVTYEEAFSGPQNEPLYGLECEVLAYVRPDFADAISLEGTGRLTDGRLLNLYGACGCPSGTCFFEADEDHPWGYGVESRALRPFRSIAVDTSVLNIGQAYYLPAFDGLWMPGDSSYGSFTHDGCVVADDIGWGINGQHIDFISAAIEHYQELVMQTGDGSIELREGGDLCAYLAD